MKTLKTLLLALLLTITSLASAQKTADQVIKHSIDNIKKHSNVEIDIDYKIINQTSAINENQNGKITLKDNAYKIETIEQTIISDGKTVWTFLPNIDEVTITEDDGSMSPIKIIENTYKHHKTRFANNDKGNGLRIIEITNDNNDIEKIVIIIDEKNYEVKSFTTTDLEGNKHIVTLKTYNYDVPADKNLFSPTEADFPDAEIIDMR